MASKVSRRDVLRASAAGSAGLWLGGIPLADLVRGLPRATGERVRVRAAAPASLDDLAYLTIAEAADLIARKVVSPLDLVDACLARIATHDGTIEAYVAVLADQAREEARRATEFLAHDPPPTPLFGIPIAHKDLYDVEGVPTRAGSNVRRDAPAARHDATIVARLRGAGAIVLGKTNTHEFAYGVWTPPTSNPWSLDRVPGGSSGGSAAAIASGFTLGATGTDTGGSIRIPSSLCNAVGLKPTYGRSSRAGVVVLAWTLDHTGPICRSVEDCAIVLNAIAGRDPRDPTTAAVPVPDFAAGLGRDITGRVVGVPKSVFFDGVDPQTGALVRAAAKQLADLGARVVEIDVPSTQYEAATAYTVIQLAEPLAAHETYIRGGKLADYQTQTQALFALGEEWTAQHYLRAQRVRTMNIREWVELFGQVDAVLTPTTPRPAPTKTEAQATGVFDLINYTSLFDFNGCPSISVPAGFTAEGLPVGVMLSARPFDEARLLQVAYAYQQATGFNRRRPTR